MRYISLMLVCGAVVFASGYAWASNYAIPAENLDIQKVYYGSASGFDKAGKIDYEQVIKATEEYEVLKKKRVKRGTGKYWILLSKASERAVHAIGAVGQETDYDLIAAQGYLADFESSIPSEDITELVLAKLGKGPAEKAKKLVPESNKP